MCAPQWWRVQPSSEGSEWWRMGRHARGGVGGSSWFITLYMTVASSVCLSWLTPLISIAILIDKRINKHCHHRHRQHSNNIKPKWCIK
ncbi:hypothetical protein PIB30_064575 [Stylosanthes scabra]|nr:hypothetical protein [Stylosanthes scabra]